MGLPQGNLFTLQESFPSRSEHEFLDEFCQVCGYNRKYAIRLLNGPAPQKSEITTAKGRRPTYGGEGHLNSDHDLGGRGLPLLSAAQSSPTPLANHRVSPSLELLQPSLRPLTRAERQAVLEISEMLGINLGGETEKN